MACSQSYEYVPSITSNSSAYSQAGGPEVWRQMNVVFAKHLEAEGEIHRAVLHLLAINQIEEAIKTYQRNTLFAYKAFI